SSHTKEVVMNLKENEHKTQSSSNNNEGKNENTSEENLPKSSSNNNEGKNENTMEEKNSNSRLFSCNYCHNKFSTQQALAGHQNAHRAERALEKRRKERPLGVRMESLIRKPPSDSPNIGHGALSLRDMLNPSLVSLKNNIEGCSNGVGVQGIGGETTPRIEDDAGNKFVDFLNLGDSSNVDTTSNIMDLNLNSNNEEESSNSESE
ncbi:zinc finger protein, partial [Trifolium medium]|nr:zinc finger protein [Trifolium medium]